MNKKKFSLLMRLLFIASLLLGIILNLQYADSITRILSYYTLQVNILCCIAFVILVIADVFNIKYKNKVYYCIKGEMIICVLIMFTVYIFALMPRNFQMYRFSTKNGLANILVHIVSPILVVIDYLLFDEKGNFKRYYPFLWTSFPLIYVEYVYLYSYHGGRFYNIGGSRKYAYLFLDIERYGYRKVAFWIVCFAIGIVAIGYIVVLIDKLISKFVKRK